MKRLIHTFTDYDNFRPICGMRRNWDESIMISPLSFINYAQHYEDELFKVCQDCQNHEDIPLLVLAVAGEEGREA